MARLNAHPVVFLAPATGPASLTSNPIARRALAPRGERSAAYRSSSELANVAPATWAAGPVRPMAPMAPIDAIDPTEPIDAIEPTDPIEATDPIDPIEPSEPTQPIDSALRIDSRLANDHTLSCDQ